VQNTISYLLVCILSRGQQGSMIMAITIGAKTKP